jgi:hypothetical protein
MAVVSLPISLVLPMAQANDRAKEKMVRFIAPYFPAYPAKVHLS